MKGLRESLTALDIQLAYDDFGVGQSRLTELAVVRPDVVKFDMCLIRNVHIGSPGQKIMLSNLVRMVQDLEITPLVEGVECEEEHQICCEVGFELGQGFFYGRPESAAVTERLTRGEVE